MQTTTTGCTSPRQKGPSAALSQRQASATSRPRYSPPFALFHHFCPPLSCSNFMCVGRRFNVWWLLMHFASFGRFVGVVGLLPMLTRWRCGPADDEDRGGRPVATPLLLPPLTLDPRPDRPRCGRVLAPEAGRSAFPPFSPLFDLRRSMATPLTFLTVQVGAFLIRTSSEAGNYTLSFR